jgi:GAF domain-containing protein
MPFSSMISLSCLTPLRTRALPAIRWSKVNRGLRFYAGALLQTPDGIPLGTVCVLDYVVRELSEAQATTLQALARQVMTQLELRRALAAHAAAEERQDLLIRELHHRVRNTLATVQAS